MKRPRALRKASILYDGQSSCLWPSWLAAIRNPTSPELCLAPVFPRVEIVHQSFGGPRFSPPPFLSGPVAVQIEADDGGRNPLTFRYQWYINQHRVDGETHPTLSPTLLKLGDKVQVEIVRFDGQTSWKSYRTGAAIVGNTSPEVVKVSILSRLDPTEASCVPWQKALMPTKM